MKKFFFNLLILLTFLLFLFFQNEKVFAQSGSELVSKTRGKILSTEKVQCEASEQMCTKYSLEISKGPNKGKKVETVSRGNVFSAQNPQKGDEVFLEVMRTYDKDLYTIVGIVREKSILLLLVVFILITLIVGRLQGFGSLIGLAVSILVLFFLTIPMILKGWNPLLAGFLGALLILIFSIYLSHGFNPKTTTALISTILGMLITTIITVIFINLIKLTGFGEEEAFFLMSDIKQDIDMKGILFVSIIIGGIGVIDDVTVNQISAMQQIYSADPEISRIELLKKSLKLGRDHIASMVNTLFIAYAAASLPLVMLLRAKHVPFLDIINGEVFAEEIARTLISSIGLILMVPITSYVASFLITREGAKRKWLTKKEV